MKATADWEEKKQKLYFSELITLINNEKEAETVMVYRSEKKM